MLADMEEPIGQILKRTEVRSKPLFIHLKDALLSSKLEYLLVWNLDPLYNPSRARLIHKGAKISVYFLYPQNLNPKPYVRITDSCHLDQKMFVFPVFG